MAAPDVLIELRDVHFAHGQRPPVLRGADFVLRPGQRLGLTGANGSGKTTLLHVIMGLLRPQSGEVRLLGTARQSEAEFAAVRPRLGLLFQDPDDQLFCPTVAEDVGFGPFNLGKRRDEVDAIVPRTLALLGLAGFEERITYQLSAGEKRLVALATVLALDPVALLLDEPDSGLDEQALTRVEKVLNDLRLPMLVVSHDRAFLARVTDERVRLQDGVVAPQVH